MELFLDSANLEEIREAAELGVISGVTTNPTLVAREKGMDFFELVERIAGMVPGPVSAEVISTGAAGMVEEAQKLAAIRDNVVVKIPLTAEGLKAVNVLNRQGIKTNVTLVFSLNQALLAARAGAAYVSPFVGRLDDIGFDGMSLVADIAAVYEIHSLKARVIAASIRHPLHVVEAAKAGAHIATIPYKVLLQMIEHPVTRIGIERFLADWENAAKKPAKNSRRQRP
ncbi:MAG: fructose-6-phosphate aldolase [Peptococcaceae bacterium]|jgi:transaldolase|nr:fructose-6-phosphate aldolase [Peptococcaceae bacterium]MDH7523736.1 fructose-6-phosphate aldolase [Peptococcaceae bacterium]